ncbi:hypothetical protein VF21_02836 [Pseudogymnoascus sp. 05NY08]|nr:hypothetical protein VF21_02836 [Pseudogymnoascus sp. 05NY08]
MSQDVSNQIRDFRYDMSSEDHRQFLEIAFDIGMLPSDPISNADAFAFAFGLRIGLFPLTFLDYLRNGLNGPEFSSEDSNSVALLLQGVEQALRQAFGLPAIQIEVSPRKNFSQSMGQETVKIIVGEGDSAKTFVVHKDLLMDKVSFFEKMFNSEFLEASAGSATLPEDSPEAFEVLVKWIYCSTLKSLHRAGYEKQSQADLAISTVGLADKYILPELGDRAMSFLANVGRELAPTMGQMSTLYEQTPSNSKARAYAARTVAWALVNPEASGVSSTSIQTACQDSDLLLDAITEVRGKNGSNHGRAHTYPICDYHNHAKAPTCPYGGGQEQTTNQQTFSYQRSTKKRGDY